MAEQDQVRRPAAKKFAGQGISMGSGLGYEMADLGDTMNEIDRVLDLAKNSHQMKEDKKPSGCGCFG